MAKPLIPISYRQAILFMTYFVLYEFLTYIANDMIMPGMIQVVHTFHAPETAVASSLVAYILGGATLQIFLGPLSDTYGRRPVMLIGAALFFMLTLIIALTQTMEQFLIARFFQGMGLCFISVVGYATLHEMFCDKDAIRLSSIMGNVAITAPLLGPLAGALLVHHMGWRAIFFTIAAFSLLSLWGLWRYMPEPIGQIKEDGQRIEPASIAPKAIASNYYQLCMNPSFMLGAFIFGLLGVPCVIWIALAPVMMMNAAHVSVIEYGIWQLPIFTAAILGNVVLQRMTHRFSIIQMVWIGSLIAVLSLFSMVGCSWVFGDNFRWLVPGLMVYFFGYALAAAPLYRYILFSTEITKGTASALNSMLLMVIQAIGVGVANHLYIGHSNLHLSMLCALIGVVYLVGWYGLYRLEGHK